MNLCDDIETSDLVIVPALPPGRAKLLAALDYRLAQVGVQYGCNDFDVWR